LKKATKIRADAASAGHKEHDEGMKGFERMPSQIIASSHDSSSHHPMISSSRLLRGLGNYLKTFDRVM